MDRSGVTPLAFVSGFSLRVRGWTVLTRESTNKDVVFPARAGMDRRNRCATPQGSRFPCACGDGPLNRMAVIGSKLFSLRVRGWTAVSDPHERERSVFPARAGMDRPSGRPARFECCFPCACGDGPASSKAVLEQPKFSLRVRGWTGRETVGGYLSMVFPARAGMDRGTHDHGHSRRRFPCACGDGPMSLCKLRA